MKDQTLRIIGTDVKGSSGIVVGQIVNVLVDADGQPVGAVLDYGGFLGVGKRRIGVAWNALAFEQGAITLSLTREQLKNFPEFRDGEDAVLATIPAPPG
ncbi:PRC-barrel domain-containing protein [Pseudoroseomonas globiformis]|uniref:PRC-barrel domain-containing protein n=1 Tax=Teichococcus globiformis TaxID=2307229 RepID=A0ABV7G8L4_9PROT